MIPTRVPFPWLPSRGTKDHYGSRNEGTPHVIQEKGIYTIARIVVFKDNLLAEKMPHLAVRTKNGQLWRDREGLAWVILSEGGLGLQCEDCGRAAQQGFDEIQFDYVRFPGRLAPQFSMPNTQENRVQAVVGFLKEAREKLLPYIRFCQRISLVMCAGMSTTH